MSDAIGKPSAESEPKRRSRLADFLMRLLKEKPLGTFCGMILLLLIFVAIFADVLAPYPYKEMHLIDRLQGPSSQYLLGTDQAGRDLLSRLIIGARISVLVGLAATVLNVVIAVLIGGTSGFLGGKLDLAVQRFVDAWIAFPGLLLLLTIVSIVGKGLPQIIVVLGVAGGIGGSRVIRSAVIAIKENDYFLAARAVGTPTSQILNHHVLPNIMAPVIIIFSINIGGVIMSLASLGFLGYGLPPSIPDWGGMLSREGRKYMEQAPWLALWPGLFLTIVVYSFNMFGDALRDLLDPRLRGGQGSYGTAKMKRKRGLLSRLLNPFA
jgi:peptide/nickel transport system permease protein